MSKRFVLAAMIVVSGLAATATAGAATVPAACAVVSAGPAGLQLGYAPGGPTDCVSLPTER